MSGHEQMPLHEMQEEQWEGEDARKVRGTKGGWQWHFYTKLNRKGQAHKGEHDMVRRVDPDGEASAGSLGVEIGEPM